MANHKDADKESPTSRNKEVQKKSLVCQHCGKLCKTAGLGIHEKEMHRQQNKKFPCQSCEKVYTTALTRKNPEKTCEGEPERNGNKQFKVCKKWSEISNFARHTKRYADYSRGLGEEQTSWKIKAKTRQESRCLITMETLIDHVFEV